MSAVLKISSLTRDEKEALVKLLTIVPSTPAPPPNQRALMSAITRRSASTATPFSFFLVDGPRDEIRVPLFFARSFFSAERLKETSAKSFVDAEETKDSFSIQVTLRKEQESVYSRALLLLQRTGGAIIGIPPGGGKTILGTLLAHESGKKWAVIVPRKTLVSQWEATFLKCFGNTKEGGGIWKPEKKIPKNSFISQDGEILPNPNKQDPFQCIITMDTQVQSIPLAIRNQIGFLILDEGHMLSTPSRVGALLGFSPQYVLVETATLQRDDQTHSMMYAVAGTEGIFPEYVSKKEERKKKESNGEEKDAKGKEIEGNKEEMKKEERNKEESNGEERKKEKSNGEERKDGKEEIEGMLENPMEEERKSFIRDYRVIVYNTRIAIPEKKSVATGLLDYTAFCVQLSQTEGMNRAIVEIVKMNTNRRKWIILTKLASHATFLSKALVDSGISSDTMIRNQKKHRNVQALVGTMPKIGTGYDQATFCLAPGNKTFSKKKKNQSEFDSSSSLFDSFQESQNAEETIIADTLLLTHTVKKWQSFEQFRGRVMRAPAGITPAVVMMMPKNPVSHRHFCGLKSWIEKTGGKVLRVTEPCLI